MTEQLDLSIIRLDGGTQTRAGTDPVTIRDYADAITNGDNFPAGIVYHDGTHYWLADGFHRVAAALAAGLTTFEFHVRQGTQRDAVLYSVGANSTHGLKRSNADKRRAVETLLLDEEWAQWSDREIARRAGVSAPFVGDVRAELAPTVKHLQSDVRRGADGRAIDTANIGTKPEEEAAPEPDAPANNWAVGYWYGEFWSEVTRCGLDRVTVCQQLQPGATDPTQLRLAQQETWSALKRLGTAHVRAAFPKGSYVAHSGGDIGIVEDWGIQHLGVKIPQQSYVQQWHLQGLRAATQEAYDAYLLSIEEAKRKAAEQQRKEGKKTTLKADTLKPHAKLSWDKRYAAVRTGVHAAAVLVVMSEQGAAILGDDVERAAAALKSKTIQETAFGPLLLGTNSWSFDYDLPRAGLDVVLYNDKSIELARFLWRYIDFGDTAVPAHAPGDLVKHKDKRIGLVLNGSRFGINVKLGGFKPGKSIEDYWHNEKVELHEQWQPGTPPLVPPLLPPPDPPPLPWRANGNKVVDAKGKDITAIWGGEKGFPEFLAGHIADAVNKAASSPDLAAFIVKIARLAAGGLGPGDVIKLRNEARQLTGWDESKGGDATE